MTTELEQEFFKAFGIKKREHAFLFSEPDGSKYYYPKITDRILLELICCVPKTVLNNCTTIKEIKEAVLKDLILCARKYTAQELKHQIQQLFKEGE